MSRTRPRHFIASLMAVLLLASGCAELADLPTLTDEDLRAISLAQSSKVFDSDGRLITTMHGIENRTSVPIKKIPDNVINAIVAIEDERYWEHHGVDVRAILRALVANLTSGSVQEGGSTITQQYIKQAIIAPGETAAKTLRRKIDEAALARQIETKLSKEEILERYLNTVYFGNGAYGIQAAARVYFNVTAAKLTLGQAALLAAVINAPEYYDPFDEPERALSRRNLVLAQMARQEYITDQKAIEAEGKKLKLNEGADESRYPAPYFMDYVQRLIKYDPRFRAVGKTPEQREQQMFQGGLRIYTTIDMDAQRAAEDAIADVLYQKSDPYASLVAVEPETGEIKAMVGGRDWFATRKEDPYAKLNLAVLAEPGLACVRNSKGACKEPFKAAPAPGTGRQAGSSFKPFALIEAIRQGVPLSKVYKAPACIDLTDSGGAPWHACNYEGQAGGKKTLLEATVSSINTVYAQLILEVGAAEVAKTAEAMGIRTPVNPFESTVLGSSEVNPLDMASAYGVLANQGELVPPVAVTRIVGPEGKVLYEDKSKAEEVIEPQAAYLATTALEQVIQRGTGVRAAIARPAAGKTGTAQEYRDAWFAGYTPDLSTAVWVGYPEGQIEMKGSCAGSTSVCRVTRLISGSGVTGGSFPAMIWQQFMTAALAGVSASGFSSPGGFVTVTIDTRCGKLAGRFTPEKFRAEAQFIQGSAPKATCRLKNQVGKVPDLFSFPLEDAINILTDEGFDYEVIEQESNEYPPGRVIAQDPASGTKLKRGKTVTLWVSVKEKKPEKVEVPDVVGMTRAQAEQTLQDAGFTVRTITEAQDDQGHNPGRVWDQNPNAGQTAEEGSEVTIWVNPD